jgi:hypothetical protein
MRRLILIVSVSLSFTGLSWARRDDDFAKAKAGVERAVVQMGFGPGGREKAPIDVDYRPKVGDAVLLGIADLEEGKDKREHIYPPDCFSAFERAVEFMQIDDKDEGRVDRRPEHYLPRACTAAMVRERRIASTMRGGKAVRMVGFRVEIMEGEFKDRLFWLPSYEVFRFK